MIFSIEEFCLDGTIANTKICPDAMIANNGVCLDVMN